ncbi:BlaI/MecI/CopY family transcriptional regulator [Anaeromicropila populeti]|uniref:Predicted transcriptional regulator n=1 Tax=Anaeromicropila populeti TaxID=37658 RepID=A0A1I6ISR4_9FIRM|nr:BlaI/MecI/CopY family transcriptional regulator [Anaeromicropila populeti]SFR69778.1 Predicted transcriptional regulator [Anaeromicropila populeti]
MDAKDNYERLPDSELLVMKIIWEAETPVGTGKVVELVSEQKDWTRSTIQVLLTRLEERGFIGIEKRGRFKYYIPLIEEEEYLAKETKTFLEQFYSNSYKKLIASLVQDQAISKEDMDDIIQIITDAKRGEKND